MSFKELKERFDNFKHNLFQIGINKKLSGCEPTLVNCEGNKVVFSFVVTKELSDANGVLSTGGAMLLIDDFSWLSIGFLFSQIFFEGSLSFYFHSTELSRKESCRQCGPLLFFLFQTKDWGANFLDYNFLKVEREDTWLHCQHT